MGGVSRGQIAAAKEVNILDYLLAHEANNVKRVGTAIYQLKDHDSLIISNGLWHWKSRDIGGKNVIDYLIKVRGYSFVDAVTALAPAAPYQTRAGPRNKPPPVSAVGSRSPVSAVGSRSPASSVGKAPPPSLGSAANKPPPVAMVGKPPPSAPSAPDKSFSTPVKPPSSAPLEENRNPLSLPRRNADNERVISYLRKRGIDETLIRDCIERGLLYESARFHNCVFVGRDERNKARFTALRGTTGNFKRDATGSDKRYGFAIPPGGNSLFGGDGRSAVTVFESPIDALSFQTLYPDDDSWKLSLGGTALSALMQFLRAHGEVRYVTVCTDNDEAGEMAAKNIAAVRGIEVTRLAPPVGKDWNETLMRTSPPREVAAPQIETIETGKKPSFIGRLHKAQEIVAANVALIGDISRKRDYAEH